MAWRFVTDGGEYHEDAAPRVVGVLLVLSGMLFFALLVGLIGEFIEKSEARRPASRGLGLPAAMLNAMLDRR